MALSTTYRRLELLSSASRVVESALTAVGFAVIVYSLHVERRSDPQRVPVQTAFPSTPVVGSMPTALCFDAYGTLFDTASVRDRLRERLDAPAGVVDAVVELWREKQLAYSYQLALMDAYRPFRAVTDDALDYALDYYGFDPRAVDVDAALAAYEALAPHPDAEPTLDRLAEEDYRLTILSNGDPGMLEAVVEHAGLEDRFEAVVSADEVETYKPSPAVYERAAERLDEPLADCWLVSANAWDAAGAAQAGMGVSWINRTGDPPERVGGEPDLTVASLTALVDELG